MTKIDERKNIIVSLKSNYREENKGIDRRIKYLRNMSVLNTVMSIIFGGIILISIISEQFGFEILKWEKSSLLVILSIAFFINFPREIYEVKLLKHLKTINDFKDFSGIDKLNLELKNLIDKLNNRKKTNLILIVFLLVLMFMALWQTYNQSNTYWNYMKIPILLFFGYTVFNFMKVNKKLTENINQTENTKANTYKNDAHI